MFFSAALLEKWLAFRILSSQRRVRPSPPFSSRPIRASPGQQCICFQYQTTFKNAYVLLNYSWFYNASRWATEIVWKQRASDGNGHWKTACFPVTAPSMSVEWSSYRMFVYPFNGTSSNGYFLIANISSLFRCSRQGQQCAVKIYLFIT